MNISTNDKNQKIVLVTGANKGLGLEIARQLGGSGLTTLVGARDAERGQAAVQTLRGKGFSAHLIALDVTDEASIEAAAQSIESDFGHLDILINNAGVALETEPPSQASMEKLRQTFDTNFFGVFAVTQAMLPLLRKSGDARIINMSSDLGSLTWASDPNYEQYSVPAFAYRASKTALNAFTVALAKELADSKIKVYSANPGYTATDLNGHSGPRTTEQGASEPVRLALAQPAAPSGHFTEEDGEVPW
ncbi:MAG: SDR family oxidoreductase [Nostoc sp. NMS1]|uniref:SDR family oxidoreductase n=1 Tax=unclassified Nostoc TaxID=2593658 RepID=UPI0025F661C5|nr:MULTISPECIES: SDR family oxidoreductase [unclassified Nostoc]MBN3908095.1 SDR family oxidoreductase [Nostoc sp. NMS1]MBN3990615.1 SDR family oxidoreductase [Nostoc sp. NMS2]